MRIKLFFAIALFPLMMLGQTLTDKSVSDDINDIKRKLKSMRSFSYDLDDRLVQVEDKLNEISAHLSHQMDANKKLQEQIRANLLTQAQNERAVNLALDEFSKKFEDQNKTMDGVKAALVKQANQQLIFYAISLIVFVVILIFAMQYSAKKAIKQQIQSWNELNEYIIKR
jgi:ABC-type transporter Mla subunit MlaD